MYGKHRCPKGTSPVPIDGAKKTLVVFLTTARHRHVIQTLENFLKVDDEEKKISPSHLIE